MYYDSNLARIVYVHKQDRNEPLKLELLITS